MPETLYNAEAVLPPVLLGLLAAEIRDLLTKAMTGTPTLQRARDYAIKVRKHFRAPPEKPSYATISTSLRTVLPLLADFKAPPDDAPDAPLEPSVEAKVRMSVFINALDDMAEHKGEVVLPVDGMDYLLNEIQEELELASKKETKKPPALATVAQLRMQFSGSAIPRYGVIADRLKKQLPELPDFDLAKGVQPTPAQKAKIRLILFIAALHAGSRAQPAPTATAAAVPAAAPAPTPAPASAKPKPTPAANRPAPAAKVSADIGLADTSS